MLDMRQKAASDGTIIEELKLQVGVARVLSHSRSLLDYCSVQRNGERSSYLQAWAGRSTNSRPHAVCSCRRPRLTDAGTLS